MRLKDADELIKAIIADVKIANTEEEIIDALSLGAGELVGTLHAIEAIKNASTIEAEPRKHGRWIYDGKGSYGLYKCSECNYLMCDQCYES